MNADAGLSKLFLKGWMIIVIGLGSILFWAFTAKLESAALAFGVVEPQSGVHKVQHLEGGIAREIRVKNGDVVKPGDILLVLDDTQAKSQFKRLQQRLLVAEVENYRLELELDDQPWVVQSPIDAEIYEPYLLAQEKLFTSRSEAYLIQLDIMEQKVRELENQIVGLSEQKKSAQQQVLIINGQLKDLQGLEKKNLVSKTDRLKLESALANYQGQVGKLKADIARVEQNIGEARLNRMRLQRNRTEKITNEYEENQKLIVDLQERLTAAEDILNRTTVTAEIAGTITDVRIKATGEVISEGDAVMKIVPLGETMLIRARIDPDDIDVVKTGLKVDIRLTAFSMRRTRPIHGEVIDVSADRSEARDGGFYYEARVSIDENSLPDNMELYPGMSAQLAIISGENTVWQYLFNPVLQSMEMALREN